MMMVDMMRYRDKDGYGGNGEDDGEDEAEIILDIIVAHPSRSPPTHTLFITAHSYCNTILHHPYLNPHLNPYNHPHHL